MTSEDGAMDAATRVLVVDDEANISDLVATVLRYEGFDVRVADSGRGALAAVRTFDPDLVVLDIMLPDLDGFEVHRRRFGWKFTKADLARLLERLDTGNEARPQPDEGIRCHTFEPEGQLPPPVFFGIRSSLVPLELANE